MDKSKQTFHFNPPIPIEGSWMIGLTSLELHNSIFDTTEENNRIELYRDNSNRFGFLELKDEPEDILNIPHISQEHLQDEIIGPRNIDEFLKLAKEKQSSDGYMILLQQYSRSPFREFESYLRMEVDSDEEDIQFVLKQ